MCILYHVLSSWSKDNQTWFSIFWPGGRRDISLLIPWITRETKAKEKSSLALTPWPTIALELSICVVFVPPLLIISHGIHVTGLRIGYDIVGTAKFTVRGALC